MKNILLRLSIIVMLALAFWVARYVDSYFAVAFGAIWAIYAREVRAHLTQRPPDASIPSSTDVTVEMYGIASNPRR